MENDKNYLRNDVNFFYINFSLHRDNIFPTMAISILSICSVVLTGINLKFKFQDKNLEIKWLIDKLNKIRLKLEYINSCNGNLPEHEYQELFREYINIV